MRLVRPEHIHTCVHNNSCVGCQMEETAKKAWVTVGAWNKRKAGRHPESGASLLPIFGRHGVEEQQEKMSRQQDTQKEKKKKGEL